MKIVRKVYVTALLSFFLLTVSACNGSKNVDPVPNNESQNGGNGIEVVNNGKTTFTLADFLYKPSNGKKYKITPMLEAQIRKVFNFSRARLNLPIVNKSNENFLEDTILGPRVDYVLVDELPKDICGFMSKANLPFLTSKLNFKMVNAGCTLGYTTYIVEKYFKYFMSTSPDQIPYFFIHERTHAIADRELIKNKAELVHALWVINTKYLPALDDVSANKNFQFNDEELRVVNLLPDRWRKLMKLTTKDDVIGDFVFTREGGLLITKHVPGDLLPVHPKDEYYSSWSIVNPVGIKEGVTLTLGTIIESLGEVEPDEHDGDEVLKLFVRARGNTIGFHLNSIGGINLRLENVKLRFWGHIDLLGIKSTLRNLEITRAASHSRDISVPLENPKLEFHNIELSNLKELVLLPNIAKYKFGVLGDETIIFDGENKRFVQNALPSGQDKAKYIVTNDNWEATIGEKSL
jgi:hypothetical protein